MRLVWTTPWLTTLLLVILVVAAGLLIRRHYHLTRPGATPRMRRLLTALRILALILLAAAVAGPRLVRESLELRPVHVSVVIEDSQSMVLSDLPSGLSRWERALQIASDVDSLLKRIDDDVRLDVWRGNGLNALVPLDDPPAEPSSVGTHLETLLRQTALSVPDGPRTTILISDGHETVGAVSLLDGTAAPVVVGLGDPLGPPDVWIQDLRAPDAAFVGDKVIVEATIGLRGRPADASEPITVTLLVGDREVDHVEIVPQPGDERVRCELHTSFDAEGLEVLRVRLGAGERELYLENNEATAALRVHAARRRILLLDSRPDWLVRFLAQAAVLEDRIELVVITPTAAGPARADSALAWSAPSTVAQWLQWDAVILGDDHVARSWIDAPTLAEAVTQGLGLMLIQEPEGISWPTALANLGPVVGIGRPGRGKLKIALARGGEPHAILEGLDPLSTEFDRLPPLVRWNNSQARADAVVLLEAQGEAGREHPLLVASSVGDERVLWLGAPDLWTQIFWRPPRSLDESRRPLDRLTRNMLVWLAQGDDAAGATLLGQRVLYAEGEPIRIRARNRGLRGEMVKPPRALEVLPLTAPDSLGAMRLSLSVSPADPETGETVLPLLPPGRYQLQTFSDVDQPLGESREIVVEARSPERFQTTQDHVRLRALAAAPGGVYFDGSQPALPDSLDRRLRSVDYEPASVVRISTLRLSSTWLFLLLMSVCLGLEWFLRRRQGML